MSRRAGIIGCLLWCFVSTMAFAENIIAPSEIQYLPASKLIGGQAPSTGWTTVEFGQRIPISEPRYLLRLKYQIDMPFEQPAGLFVSLLGAYEVSWDGAIVGQNGQPALDNRAEIPGHIDYLLLLPPEYVSVGEHRIELRVSSARLSSPDEESFLWSFLGDYDFLLTIGVKRAITPLVMSGATLLIALYLFYSFFFNKAAPIYLLYSGLFSLSLFALMLVESWRGLVGYLYHWHEYRLWLVNGLSFIAALSLLLYTQHFLNSSAIYRHRITALFAVVSGLVLLLSNSFDVQSLVLILAGSVLSVVTAAIAVYRRKPYARLLLVCLGLFLLPVSLGLLDFTDRYFFVSSFVLLLFILVIQAQQLKQHQLRLAESQLSQARLELELVKRNIQPHFILNTLTAIEEWIEQSPKTATEFIQALANEFRMVSKVSAQPLITVHEEISICENHMRIMGFRNDSRFSLDAELVDGRVLIPPGVLLTMVENAISHNPSGREEVMFSLRQSIQDNQVALIFQSPLNRHCHESAATAMRTGTGTKYIHARMREAFADEWHYAVSESDGLCLTRLCYPLSCEKEE